MTWSAFDGLLQDLRYTFRTLRRDAGFATFAILIVGLGIGASTTVFSVVNTLLLRPLPFRDPSRLVVDHEPRSARSLRTRPHRLATCSTCATQNQSFADLAAYFAFYGVGDNKLTGQGEPERLSSVPVSCNFFPLLGVQPQLGRLFNAEECKWHGPKAVLLSSRLLGAALRLRPRHRRPPADHRRRAGDCSRRPSGFFRFRRPSSLPAATSICTFRSRSRPRPTAGATPWRSSAASNPASAFASAQAELKGSRRTDHVQRASGAQ